MALQAIEKLFKVSSKGKMTSKLCLVLLLLILSRGSPFPKDAPAYSLMGAIQHGGYWRAVHLRRQTINHPKTIVSTEIIHDRRENHSDNKGDDEKYKETRIENIDEQKLLHPGMLPAMPDASASPDSLGAGILQAANLNLTSISSSKISHGNTKAPEPRKTVRATKNQVSGERYTKNTASGGVERMVPSSKMLKDPRALPHASGGSKRMVPSSKMLKDPRAVPRASGGLKRIVPSPEMAKGPRAVPHASGGLKRMVPSSKMPKDPRAVPRASGGLKSMVPSPKVPKGLKVVPHGELPDDVCDRCPVNALGVSRLSPCTCVGNTGNQAGKISITCPDTIHNTEELKGILTENKDYITTHVFRFSLQNSKVDGVISQALWGELDFVQVLLDNNEFDWVDNKAFANSNETLHYLSLKNNNLKQFTTGETNELPYLATLDLSHNNLSVVFTDAFTYKGLTYLDLSYNQITSIGKRSFAELDNLTELYLNKNQLTKLEEDTFKFNSHSSLSDLLVIDISDNNINYIAKTAFAGLFWVQINLQNNQLKTVNEEAFNHVLVDSSYYAVISLMGNPIVCDCSVYWIVNSTRVQSSFDNFMCVNLGIPIRETTIDDLGNCTSFGNESTTSITPLYEVPLG
ncbi:toll-like receptor 7 [Palaemon carinicauda]|uniref:toll-like receptor 7 n=1 Tax=Palaemon carinicauda TaxID=392227 RepID=UPI0035B59CE0